VLSDGDAVGDFVGSVLSDGDAVGDPLGAEVGDFVGSRLTDGDAVGEAVGNEELVGASLWGVELGITDDSEGDNVGLGVFLHLVLHTEGQKSLTISPVAKSVLLHLRSFLEAAHEQSFVLSPLNANVVLSWHAPRSVGEELGASVGTRDAVGLDVGLDVFLQLLLHTTGHEFLTLILVSRSIFLHRLIGFKAAQLSQPLAVFPSNAKVESFWQSPRIVGESVGDSDGLEVLQLLLHTTGHEFLTFISVSRSIFLHRLIGFKAAQLSQLLAVFPSNAKVESFWHSIPTLLNSSIGDSDGDSDGQLSQAFLHTFLTFLPELSFASHLSLFAHPLQPLFLKFLSWILNLPVLFPHASAELTPIARMAKLSISWLNFILFVVWVNLLVYFISESAFEVESKWNCENW
jgi:hypothetical protein